MIPPEAARIAAAYDAIPYDPQHGEALDLAVLRGALAALGTMPSATAAPAVLDIGCGAGGLLARAASQGAGRLVGIDASATMLALARDRLGATAELHHADAAATDAEALGRFDVVYLVAVLFAVPPAMRAALLRLAAACLAPGGVLVVTVYTGVVADLRARVAAVLRAENDPAASPGAQIAGARANLQALLRSMPKQGDAAPLVRGVLERMAAASAANLFHQALAPRFEVPPAVALEEEIAPHGAILANRLPPIPVDRAHGPAVLARAMDARDLVEGGGYQTLLFTRPIADAPPAGARHPALAWSTPLRRAEDRDGAPAYADSATGAGLRVPSPFNQAALDHLAHGPAAWPALRAAAAMADPGGEPLVHDRLLDDLLDTMWRARLATPLWR